MEFLNFRWHPQNFPLPSPVSDASCTGCYGGCSGNIGVVFDNLFVDKDGQNLLVDVEEIFESLLSVQEIGEVLFVVGKVPD